MIVGGETAGRWIGGTSRLFRALLLSPFLRQNLRGVFATVRAEDVEFLRGLVEEGKVMPVIDRTYSLDEARQAIRYVQDGHASGKVVVTV